MAITFVNATTGGNTGTSLSHVISVPAGVSDGDLLIAQLTVVAESTLSPPAGWTELYQESLDGPGSGSMTTALYYRVANSEPASYTFTSPLSRRSGIAMVALSGTDPANPIVDSGWTGEVGADAISAPSVAGEDDSWLVVGVGWAQTGNSAVFPLGMTSRVNHPGLGIFNIGTFVATEPVGTGPTGGRNITTSESGTFTEALAFSITVRPAGDPAPEPVELDLRSGIVTGSRIQIAVDRNIAIRSGVITGSRIAIATQVHIPLPLRSGVITGSRIAIAVDAPEPGETTVALRSGVVAGSRIAIQVDVPVHIRSGVIVGTRVVPVAPVDGGVYARSGVIVGSRIAIKVDVPVAIRSGVIIGARQAFQFHRNVRIRAGVIIGSREGYTGPGTGIVVPGQRFSVNSLREGDTFTVYLPWAGLAGMTGLAHVNSRTLRDDRHEQDVDLHITPLDAPNIPALAGGARPVAGADQTDAMRRQARTEREQDRIERNR